jgi:hypothetical protein
MILSLKLDGRDVTQNEDLDEKIVEDLVNEMRDE